MKYGRWTVLIAFAMAGCIENPNPAGDDALPPPEPEPAAQPEPAPEPDPQPQPEPAPQPDPQPLPDPNPGPAVPQIREPEFHRPFPEDCDDVRPPTQTMAEPGAECQTDADCVEGRNGRCVYGRFVTCSYDECLTDAECAIEGGAGVCACEGSWLGDANACYGGNCRTNLDCDTGYCSPSFGDCGDYSGFENYYCHTFEDECIDDADCGGGGAYCAFMPQRGVWACSNSQCDGK